MARVSTAFSSLVLLLRLKRFVAEVQGSGVVALQHEEANRHGRIALLEQFVVARDEFVRGEAVALGLRHLPAIDGEHVAVNPVAHRVLFPVGTDILGDLTLVVREFQVHATAVDVEGAAKVFGAHHGALEVPSREAHAPRRGPAHEVAFVGLLPQGEVEGVLLLILAVEGAGLVLQLVNAASAEGTVIDWRISGR